MYTQVSTGVYCEDLFTAERKHASAKTLKFTIKNVLETRNARELNPV